MIPITDASGKVIGHRGGEPIKLAPKPERKRVETDIVHEILAELARVPGVRVARNNVGTIEDVRGIPVTFGLGEGSPDLVGILTFGGVESTYPELAELAPISLAFGIEVKQPKRYATRQQKAWHLVAKRRGMPVGLARSKEDARAFVEDLRVQIRARLRAIGGALA